MALLNDSQLEKQLALIAKIGRVNRRLARVDLKRDRKDVEFLLWANDIFYSVDIFKDG